jgi:GT2 family glycosyltransferase
MLEFFTAKTTAVRMFVAKILRLFKKTYVLSLSSPRLVPGKIKRKLFNFIISRLDTGFLHRGSIRILGQFYPASELLALGLDEKPSKDPPPIVVIIPVYRNVAITKRCIDSALGSNLPPSTRVLILNDCSPDAEMPALLDAYKVDARVEVIHNKENLGFVRNVNNGMTLAADADVVLLNSDTVVSGHWLWGLRAHSCSSPRVSSVTATSNNATICSFPGMDGYSNWPLGLSTRQVDEVLYKHNRGRAVAIPTGVGFCMYITRRSINALGLFDADTFGKGYGEENDFCLRGLKQGWKHLQALDVGVFHEGEVSFGSASHPGKMRAAEIITKRYPYYDALVGEFFHRDPARAIRLGALLAMMAQAGKKVELICTHIHGGGVERAVGEYIKSRQETTNFLVLQRSLQKGFYKISSAVPGLDFSFEFSSRFSPEVFHNTIRTANVSRLHVHQVMDFDNRILKMIKEAKIPFELWIHDYWTICPQITLTTAMGRYCGEPDHSICNKCIASRGRRNLPDLPEGLPKDIKLWRQSYSWLFEQAQSISAPSRDTANRMTRYHPNSKIKVEYLEDQKVLLHEPIRLRRFDSIQRLKVGIIGGIGIHKGLFRLSELQGEIKRTNAPIELTVFGTTDSAIDLEHPVVCTGAYNDALLPAMLSESGVQAIWFPEGFPETYCYTLSHAMKNGYPILAPEVGAFPERLQGRSWSFITKPNSQVSVVLEQLLMIRKKILEELSK